MSVGLYALLFVASVVITLGGCALFTNGIEWLGKRLHVSEGAVGSVFAAVGTTLPETSIPIIAIFFGKGQEQVEVGLGAILGAPFMLSTLVIPILGALLLLYARMGKRPASFKLNYREVRTDLGFFLIGYSLAVVCAFVPSKPFHYAAGAGLIGLYIYYMKIKFAAEHEGESHLDPLFFAKAKAVPPYAMIAVQGVIGLGGLAAGAHLFVTAAEGIATQLQVSPLLLAMLIAPLATELPEMSNSFLWLYQKKDTLAVGNVTGAMVFQGTFPVSIGLFGTGWTLGSTALLTMGLAMAASLFCFAQLLRGGHWHPRWLLWCALFYLGFTIYAWTA